MPLPPCKANSRSARMSRLYECDDSCSLMKTSDFLTQDFSFLSISYLFSYISLSYSTLHTNTALQRHSHSQAPKTNLFLPGTSAPITHNKISPTKTSPFTMGACFSRPLTGDEPCEWRCAYHYGCAHPIALAAQNGPETPYARRLLKENDPYTRIYKARGYGEIPHDWAHELAPIVAAGGVVTLPNGVRVGRDGVVGGGWGGGRGGGG